MRGFTLLELMVALLLLAVMTPLLLGGLRLGTRTADAVEERTRAAQDLHLAGGFLARQIEQAQAAGFAGGPHALRFVAPLPAHLGAGGMYAFAVGLAPGAQGRDLVLSYELYQDERWERFGAVTAQRAVLARGLSAASFEYYGAGWASHWERSDELPRLVRLRVVPADGAPRELLVAPRISQPRPEG